MNKLVTSSVALLFALTFQARAAEPREEKTASGIGITIFKEGTGANPKVSDTVKVQYRGTLENGQEFDSSYKRGQPATFPLTRAGLIRGSESAQPTPGTRPRHDR